MQPSNFVKSLVKSFSDINMGPSTDPEIKNAFTLMGLQLGQTCLEAAAHRILDRKFSEEGTCLPCAEVSDHVLRLIALDIMRMECPDASGPRPLRDRDPRE